ncbi:putative polysaccharide biosynthesis protein [Sporosarcina koreensis]|uniref:putative polysaccharide biosynthesis protein n=1 Tax=Sporosarcina koreensis TaxID=334735 RepID=UPI00058EF0E3|nr:polysaccharide biosynthesis protein [Sporosarcina koreensis]
MSSFIRGTVILTFAVFMTKLLGFVYRIQFMRVAGEEAVGVYMTAYPAFIFFLSLVQLGIPIAIAKVIAELTAKGQSARFAQVMRSSVLLTIITGLIFLPLSILFVPFLSDTLLGNPAASVTLFVGIAIVPIAAVGGIIRGYFQGIARLEETAWSQVIEQIVRIGLITWMLPYFLTDGSIALNAAYAMGITLLAEAVSVLYLWIKFKKQQKKTASLQSKDGLYPVNPLLAVALPSSGSRLFGSFTWFLEPIIFIRALAVSGLTAAAATSLYGVISGVLIPLLLFPQFIPYALSVVLVPAVSGASAAGNIKKLQERIHLSLRLSALTGAFAAAVFFVHGKEMAETLFHVKQGASYMVVLAPIFFFYYIQSPLFSILQATDEAKAAMMNSVYGGIAKLLVMFVLASQPGLQETGAIVAIGFGVLITSFLHIATLRRNRKTATGFTMFVLPYASFIITAVLRPIFIPTGGYGLIADCSITALFLAVVLFFTGQIRGEDFRHFRKLAVRQR